MKQVILTFSIMIFFAQVCLAQAYWEGKDSISEGVRQPLIIKDTKENAEVLKARWAAIGEETSSTENLFAGTYQKAGYRGYYLRLAPNNGFVFIYHYENIDILDYSYGKVKISDSEITFIPEKELSKITLDNETVKTPQKWIVFGRHLVEEDEVKDYADYLSGLSEFNDWNCECTAFFAKTSRNNSPEYFIPEKYKSLFRPPVEGKITFVGKEKLVRKKDFAPQIQTQIRINVGKNQKVEKGMIFRFVQEKDVERKMTVKEVYENSSLALISDDIFEEERGLFATYHDQESDTDKPLPKIKTGTLISTKLFRWIYEQD